MPDSLFPLLPIWRSFNINGSNTNCLNLLLSSSIQDDGRIQFLERIKPMVIPCHMKRCTRVCNNILLSQYTSCVGRTCMENTHGLIPLFLLLQLVNLNLVLHVFNLLLLSLTLKLLVTLAVTDVAVPSEFVSLLRLLGSLISR